MKSKLEQLTGTICDIVPEILELKFGCLWEVAGTIWVQAGEVPKLQDNKKSGYLIVALDCFGISKIVTHEELELAKYIKILGRDIQLADVLRAIGGNTICVTGAGNFANINDLTWLADWDLSKPLHLQKQEVWNFLHSIICNK